MQGTAACTIAYKMMMKLPRRFLLAGAVCLLATSVFATDHPDMSGTWNIDAPKSDFGQGPAPDDLQLKVRVEAADFYVTQSGGGQPDQDLHFNSEGKEITNDVPGAKIKGAYHWEGPVLVGELKIATDDGNDMTFKDRISYSADGKVMTLDRAVSGPMGDGKMKIVMNKKSS
jgi:hypothetical protein